MQLDQAENALLFKGALQESEQQQGFCWENESTLNKHIYEYYILVESTKSLAQEVEAVEGSAGANNVVISAEY